MASKMVRMSRLDPSAGSLRRSHSMETYMVRVYPGMLSQSTEFMSVEAVKNTKSDEIVKVAVQKLKLGNPDNYVLAETFSSGGQLCKERRLESQENPVRIQLLWPRVSNQAEAYRTEYHFYLRKQDSERKTGSWIEFAEASPVEHFLSAFLQQPQNKEYPDLCNLPDLNENTLLFNLKSRFENGNIYTYVGSILIAVNPFKFYPIYNPKYVKMYQNRRLGDLPPHIFGIADAAYHTMLQEKRNQCIVISGESGSGKTESTNLLLHHLSALSQRALHGTGIEQTILGAGPVLEAFGNAKTVHNNNSSRFGKFIQVNYKENGMVHGAVVEKYLLEKSRIVSQAENERNYHVFYYLLAGASDVEKESFCLTQPQDYFYLNQSKCYTLEGIDGEHVDEAHEFTRLKQAMEMVGFCTETRRRIFSVLAAVLHLGNIEYKKKADHHHHEAVTIRNTSTVKIISNLLKVKEGTLIEALTKKKTTAGGEMVIMNYNMRDAIATRDAMAKCLYGGLFDWIVLQVNHALLAKKDFRDHQGNSIGVLDIFGFEDFGKNSFEQFCINYANERLHYYFNQHIFKFEQEEYVREGIVWKNIEFIDNTQCLGLFSKKPTGLLSLLDEECNFPGATNDTLLDKFHAQHQNHSYYEMPQMRESAFSVVHYAGKVKYHVQDFREKNCDLMRHDIMLVLKNSSLAFVRELVGYDPVAVLRWAIVRAFFRAYFAFIDAGKRHRKASAASKFGAILRQQTPRTQHHSLHGDMRKSKSFRPKARTTKSYRDLKAMKTLAGRAYLGPRSSKGKNKAPSVSQQFNLSLSKLMETLNHANPFFIRCIKSNANKAPCKFDEEIVVRQLRYTGMLATVKIRQSGYNYRLTFDEFIQQYKILLPKGLVSSKDDVRDFLQKLDLNQENYQIGNNKVFLREAEKMLLDEALHQAIMTRIVHIQRWMRTVIDRKHFLRMRRASVVIQSAVRGFLARRKLDHLRLQFYATILIQKVFRGFRMRKDFQKKTKAATIIQTAVRGYLTILRVNRLKERRRLEEERKREEKEKASAQADLENRLKVRDAKPEVKVTESENVKGTDIEFTDLAMLQDPRSPLYPIRTSLLDLKKDKKSEITRSENTRSSLYEVKENVINEKDSSIKDGKSLSRSSHEQSSRSRMYEVKEKRRSRLTAYEIKDSQSDDQKYKSVTSDAVRYKAGEESEKHLSYVDFMLPSDESKLYETEDVRPQEDEVFEPPVNKDSCQPPKISDIHSPMPEEIVASSPRFKVDEGGKVHETVDLHSSASDEGVLTKESSTEELIEREELSHGRPVDGHESEESSGILDDSEMDANSLETGPKSRGSSFTTPPSTPHSPQIKGDGPHLATDHFDSPKFTRVVRPDDRYRPTLSVPQLKAQHGPSDVEICIRPAIQRALSEDSMQIYSARTSVVWKEKRISAPLAKQESFGESGGIPEEGDKYSLMDSRSRSLPLSEEKLREVEEAIGGHSELHPVADLAGASHSLLSTHRSPFHRAKKHIKSIMQGGRKQSKKDEDDSDDSQSEDNGAPVSPFATKTMFPVKTDRSPRKTSKDEENAKQDHHSSKRKHRRKGSKKRRDEEKKEKVENASLTWSVSSTSQWQYPTDILVREVSDLEQLNSFVFNKILELSRDYGRRDTVFDSVFKGALKDFHTNLITQAPVAQENQLDLRYRDLMLNFEETLKARAQEVNVDNESFPVTLGINAFRGFLDEFNKKKEQKEHKVEGKEKKKKKDKDKENIYEHLGHHYQLVQFSIPTYCEFCSSLIWMVEKGYVCQVCKFAVHKKCCTKSLSQCKSTSGSSDASYERKVVGGSLYGLLRGHKVPPIIMKLITAIELNGLYTVGIYRKAGAAARCRQLIAALNADPDGSRIDFNDYPIHVLTSVIKTFFREMPEPLLTCELYDDFIRAAECNDEKERIQLLYSVIDKLPTPNHDLFEHLIFHLAKVAQHESANKMTANSLSIVFAPSIIRTNRPLPAQESLMHVPKQAMCIQNIITEQMKKIRNALANIKTLDTAAASASGRLTLIQNSKTRSNGNMVEETRSRSESSVPSVSESDNEDITEAKLLTEQIRTIQQEKEMLTIQMPSLECRHSSSEEDILSTDDIESTGEELDGPEEGYEEYAVTFDFPALSPPKNIRHLNKKRAPTPVRRPPTKRHNSDPDEDEEATSSRRRLDLRNPEFTQIGEEILV